LSPIPADSVQHGDYDFTSLAGPNQGLARQFASEQTDAAWSPGAVDIVRHELESQPVFSQLGSVDIDCKETLCRIQATLPMEVLRAMGPNQNFSWGATVNNLMHASLWSSQFDNIADMESIDQSVGQAQFITYLHRRPQGSGHTTGTAT
jgi:hypothetical protein